MKKTELFHFVFDLFHIVKKVFKFVAKIISLSKERIILKTMSKSLKSPSTSAAIMIENQEHFEELSRASTYPPFVLARRVDNRQLMYIPLSWMYRPLCARKAHPKKVLSCFYSKNIADKPSFRGDLTAVNVIKTFEGNFFSKFYYSFDISCLYVMHMR